MTRCDRTGGPARAAPRRWLPATADGRVAATAPALFALFALFALLPAPATAQAPQRNFPADALRGELRVTEPPAVLLNGRPARLAPGARIRDARNLLAMSGALAGQSFTVHYTREIGGELLDVWLLRPDEAARRPWPATEEQARAWRFDPIAQTWSRP